MYLHRSALARRLSGNLEYGVGVESGRLLDYMGLDSVTAIRPAVQHACYGIHVSRVSDYCAFVSLLFDISSVDKMFRSCYQICYAWESSISAYIPGRCESSRSVNLIFSFPATSLLTPCLQCSACSVTLGSPVSNMRPVIGIVRTAYAHLSKEARVRAGVTWSGRCDM